MTVTKSIIVEGLDNTGKSTLCQYLSDHLKLPLFRAGPPPLNEDLIKVCCEYQLGWMYSRPCIFDRVTPVSTHCYNPSMSHMCDYFLNSLSAMRSLSIFIYCSKEFSETFDSYETPEDIVKARRAKVGALYRYEMLMNYEPPDIVFNGQSPDEIIRTIERLCTPS